MTTQFSSAGYGFGERLMQLLGIVTLFAVTWITISYYVLPIPLGMRHIERVMEQRFIFALWALPFMVFTLAAERVHKQMTRRIFISLIASCLWFGAWLIAMIHAAC